MGGNFCEKLEEAPRIEFHGAIDCGWCNVDFELGTRGSKFLKDGTLQCWVLREKLVSQVRPNQPQRGSLTKDYPHWGWLDRACQTMREPTTPTKTFGRPVLENSYCVNARIATMLIHLLWWLSRAYFRLYCVERQVLAPFLLAMLLLSALLCSLLQLSHTGQLEKGDPVDQEHS